MADTLEQLVRFLRGELIAPPPVVYQREEECAVCMDAAPDCILARCGHICCCVECYKELPTKECPVCRSAIHAVLKLDK
jgi:hypothetical protein